MGKPRLAIVATNGPGTVGGLSSYVRHIASEMATDYEVSVAARFALSTMPSLSYTARERATQVVVDGIVTTTIAPSTGALPLLRASRRCVYYPRLQSLARGLFRVGFERPLARAIPEDAAIVLSIGTGWEMLGFAARSVAQRRGARFFVTPAIHTGVWGDSALDGQLYRSADGVFALSHHEADRMTALGVERSRIVVTGLAPVPPRPSSGAAFRTRHGLGGRPLVLFLGRKHRYKGYHALREAMGSVLVEQPTACLVSLGPPGEPPYPPLPPGAELDLGLVDEAEKADALAACDVFCMPSAEEAFGIVYTEAWAYGKPIVGGPAPAVRELIREDVDGYATTQDCADIAAALVRLLGDRSLRERLGAAGRERQLAEFTWPVVAERHRATFMATLGRS
jgi:glycosyltransferase involved in cell wall biosynthesis